MKTVIFDFDGTIANTLPIVFYAFENVFRQYEQRELSKQEIISMFGPTEAGSIRKYFKHADVIDEAIDQFHHDYEHKHQELVQKNAEIDELLRAVKALNLQLAMFTGKGRRGLDISMAKLEMDVQFDVIVTGDDVRQHKPHPEGLLHILDVLDTKPEDAIYLGDSDSDIQAGNQAGILTFGVQWLPEYQSTTFHTNPVRIFKNTQDFQRYLTNIVHEKA